ncbi:hypothetical protein ACMBCN_01110 [Candidatus Liberibacter asiaticus]
MQNAAKNYCREDDNISCILLTSCLKSHLDSVRWLVNLSYEGSNL